MNPFTLVPKLIRAKGAVDEIEKDVKTMNASNWRTSLHGIIVAACVLSNCFLPPKYQPVAVAVAGVFVALGFITAADAANLKK